MELIRVSITKSQHSPQLQSLVGLHKQYLKEIICGNLFPQSKYGFTSFSKAKIDVFKIYKNENPQTLTLDEEEYLIEMLSRRVSKWFVPYVLRHYDTKSPLILKKLIKNGIDTRDPGYNSVFLRPAWVVYGSSANDILLDYFEYSSMRTRRGVFRSLYWLEQDFTPEQKERKLTLFLNEYLSTRRKKLKKFLSWNLPMELTEYPEHLQEKAALFLVDMKNNPLD